MNETSANNQDYVCVGSSCLADFLGHQNPEEVVRLFGYLAEAVSAAEGFGSMGGGSGDTHFSLDLFLAHVAAIIRVDGWMSRTQARKMYDGTTATADTAWTVMIRVAANDTKDLEKEYFTTEADWKRAAECKEFLSVVIDRELEKGELNDYFHNLNVICRVGVIDFKASGIAASIIATATREMGKEIERKKFLNLKETSKHFAQPKDKVVVKATLISSMEREGNFGITTMMKFATLDGNALTWWASGFFEDGVWEIGKEYILVGTVKKNDEYQGLKQTVLTRVGSVTQEWVDAEKAKAEKKAARAAKKAEKALT